MTILDAVAGFAVVAGLLTLVPGIDTALALRAFLTRDRGYAVASAVIPQFLPAGASPLLMGAVLAGVHCVLFLTWCAVLILGSGYARRWLNTPRSLAIVDRATGVVLIGFGGRLTLDSWPTGPMPALAMSLRLV